MKKLLLIVAFTTGVIGYGQAPTFEQVLRASAYYGTELLPAIESTFEKHGLKGKPIGERFSVSWSGDFYEAVEWFKAETSWETAKVVVRGSHKEKFKVDSIEVIDQNP